MSHATSRSGQGLDISRDRFGRTSTAEVFEDAANHHNTQTHIEKKTYVIHIYIYQNITKATKGLFGLFCWILEYQWISNILQLGLKGDDSTVLYVFLCIFVGQNDSELPSPRFRGVWQAMICGWNQGGLFRRLLICRDLGFFPVFDWNCYQQTTISRNEAFHFDLESDAHI